MERSVKPPSALASKYNPYLDEFGLEVFKPTQRLGINYEKYPRLKRFNMKSERIFHPELFQIILLHVRPK